MSEGARARNEEIKEMEEAIYQISTMTQEEEKKEAFGG